MATIRREDKEIVHNLSLLGMLFGVFVGGFLVLNWNKQAHLRLEAEAAAAQTHSSLVRLSGNLTDKEVSLAQVAMGQVDAEVLPEQTEEGPGENFWSALSEWKLWSICAGAAMAGGITGYLTFWGAGWLGALLTYWTIRAIYGQIRTIAPNCPAASRPTLTAGNTSTFQRDQNRILPTLIKLFMLLAIVLSVLAVIVWQLTAI